MKKSVRTLILLFISVATVITAQNRRYANAFLEIPAGVRAASMGSAYSAIANDATAFFWNPAGSVLVNRHEVTGSYSSQFGGLAQYHVLGYNHQINNRYSFAVGWIRYSISNIPENADLSGSASEHAVPGFDFAALQHGHFSYADNAFFFTFARMNTLRLNLGWAYSDFPIQIPVGASFKIIRGGTSGISGENGVVLNDVRKSGIGVDIGTMIMFGMNDLLEIPTLGDFVMSFNLQDATTTAVQYNKISSDVRAQDIVKANFKFGMSYIQGLDEWKSNILLSYESNTRYANDRHYGLEWEYNKLAALRLGIDNGTLTYGAGFQYNHIHIDYALNNHALGYTHRIGTSYKF